MIDGKPFENVRRHSHPIMLGFADPEQRLSLSGCRNLAPTHDPVIQRLPVLQGWPITARSDTWRAAVHFLSRVLDYDRLPKLSALIERPPMSNCVLS